MENHLHILWTSDNPQTAHQMVFMYAINGKTRGWWEDITIIVWGAAAKLVAEDVLIQEKIKLAQAQGIHMTACIACAEQFGVSDKLRELDIEVKGWGAPLTELIKSKGNLLTV